MIFLHIIRKSKRMNPEIIKLKRFIKVVVYNINILKSLNFPISEKVKTICKNDVIKME